MILTNTKMNHILQSICSGNAKVLSSSSNLIFVVENIMNKQQQAVHSQKMMAYTIAQVRKHAPDGLREQGTHYDAKYLPVNAIHGAYRPKAGYNMLVSCLSFEKGQSDTWKPLEQVIEDMPGIREDHRH